MNFFPFKFSFEQVVIDFTKEYIKRFTDPSALIVLHPSAEGVPPQMLNLMDKKLVDLINEELTSYGLPHLANINIFKKPPNDVQTLHVDMYQWDKAKNKDNQYSTIKAAYNIPVVGLSGSRMVWYNGKFEIEESVAISSSGKKILYYGVKWDGDPQQDPRELDFSTSNFVKINVPHHVYVGPEETRVVTSLRFKGNPTFESIYNTLIKQDNTDVYRNEYYDVLTTEEALLEGNIVRGYN